MLEMRKSYSTLKNNDNIYRFMQQESIPLQLFITTGLKMSASINNKSALVSSIISGILSLVIFGTLRFYAHWFNGSQLNILVGGFVGSWIFIFSLTCLSNAETLMFGQDFQAKFIPEIVFCLSLAMAAAGMVHRVCATTCILFSLIGLYFINRISNKYYNNAVAATVDVPVRKSGKKYK